ncbi:MAG TPA: hypothetical protein PLX89_06375 [Verrucomicrobiota bacterium]|nr:hypothetical protein [Verrucomicrobiales bacterium]HRI12616.1 hypothetical protein [Verrucomicrobiota bacterium]
MKRREFISCLAGAPLAFGGAWAAPTLPEALVYSRSPKRRIAVNFGESAQRLIAFLQDRARGCYLHGAPVMSRLCGSTPAWINLGGAFHSFSELKRELFSFGVIPISTPELPSSMIKFRLDDLVVNLLDADLDTFCQSAYFGAKERKLAFAHSFLVWNPSTGELHDPYDAAPHGEALEPFRLIGRPASLADAFDWVLAGRFESHFLKLHLSPEFSVLEAETLAAAPPLALGRLVVERIVNYFPEVVDQLGLDVARRYATSSIVGQATREALGVDFANVFERFAQARTPRPRFKTSGVEFIATLHHALGVSGEEALLDGEICRFMVRNNFTFRRPEWLIAPTAVPNLKVNPPALA